ncbi:unnamed protein product [Arctogadus glacialis]
MTCDAPVRRSGATLRAPPPPSNRALSVTDGLDAGGRHLICISRKPPYKRRHYTGSPRGVPSPLPDLPRPPVMELGGPSPIRLIFTGPASVSLQPQAVRGRAAAAHVSIARTRRASRRPIPPVTGAGAPRRRPGPHPAPTRPPPGPHLAAPGRHLAVTWPPPGPHPAPTRPPPGPHLAPTRPSPGRHLAVTWPSPGRHLAVTERGEAFIREENTPGWSCGEDGGKPLPASGCPLLACRMPVFAVKAPDRKRTAAVEPSPRVLPGSRTQSILLQSSHGSDDRPRREAD